MFVLVFVFVERMTPTFDTCSKCHPTHGSYDDLCDRTGASFSQE